MKLAIISLFALSLLPKLAWAEETIGEKATSTTHTAVRKVKKGTHHVQEALCAEGDLKCAGKKIGHRVDEAGSAVGDKMSETEDKIKSSEEKKK